MEDETALSPETENEDVDSTEAQDADSQSAEGAEGGEASAEVEVVRTGSGGSQPTPQRGIRRRINKLNARVTEARQGEADATAALSQKEREVEVLKLALEQERQKQATPSKPPDPLDYQDDAEYAKALQAWQQPLIAAEVQKATANLAPQQQQPPVDPNLVRRQERHYAQAEEMGARDFEETEDKVISALGNTVVNELIRTSDKSHLVLYYLGKNPGELADVKELVESDPVKATLHLGELGAELQAKPRTQLETTPNPDVELEGGTPNVPNASAMQKQYDRIIKKIDADPNGGHFKELSAIRRKAREAGVTLQ